MVKDGIVLGKRYEVLSKIGAGGMADVYKGKDTMLNRYVAIKVLKKEYREDENFVRKFHSEAQAAAGLLNPNIVNVYDVGEDRGLYYMVMELVEGITLKEYIEKEFNKCINLPCIWFSGHTHLSHDIVKEYKHGNVRFISNQRAYPTEYDEGENINKSCFNKDFVVEL